MTRGLRAAAASLVVTAAMACGGASGDPPGSDRFAPVDDPGRGSGTLAIEARIEASPARGEAAASASELVTTFEVDVRDAAGERVSGALVVVESALGAVTLTEGGCGRDYCGRQNGYARTYLLSAERGADYVEGVRVVGPSFHTVTAPSQGATVDGSVALRVTWAPSSEADTTRVQTRDHDRELAGDPGDYELPAGALRVRDDRPEDERVRVRRQARLGIAGARGASAMVVEVRNGTEFTVRPTTAR
jgi:hypothetical protein